MYGPTISFLLRTGAIALLHDYRSGHALDFSGNGNHGTMSAGMRQIGPSSGWVFPATTDEVTVADAASLATTDMSVIAVGRFQAPVAGSQQIVSKRVVANVHYQFYLQAAGMVFYDGVNARTRNATLSGARSLGMTVGSGGTAIGYVDALSVGNFSGVSTITPDAVALEIGNWANVNPLLSSPLSCLLLANRILTPTEYAMAEAELAAARWPSSQYGIAKRVQGSVIGEANLLAGYTLRPSGLLVPSHNGAFTGTLSGQALYQNSILGDALALGRVTGSVDLGVGNAQINPTTDSHWVEVWARPLDVAMSDAWVPTIGKGVTAATGTYINGGIIHTSTNQYLTWYDTASRYVYSAIPPRNKLTHYVYQIDHATHQAWLYLDGVQYGPTAIGVMIAPEVTNWVVGKSGAGAGIPHFDEGFGGLVCNPRIGTGVLTPAQVLARYLEGAKAIQFKTDWGYPISPADEGGVLGQQIGGLASPFRAADTTGRWRVETDTIEGKLCKVLTCKTAGMVNVPAAYFQGAAPTEACFGTWEWWHYKLDANQAIVGFTSPTVGLPVGGYSIVHSVAEAVTLQRTAAAVLIAGGAASADAWHRYRVTRDITGTFTAYIDGVSFGSANNTAYTTSNFMVFDLDAGDKLAFADVGGGHSMYKQLGVVPPGV